MRRINPGEESFAPNLHDKQNNPPDGHRIFAKCVEVEARLKIEGKERRRAIVKYFDREWGKKF
jgi:hypothetical protein